MNKKVLLLIIAFLTIIPCSIKAYEGIENYYIEATVSDNGDLNVKEYFSLTGEFNGFERIINYKNNNAPKFDGSAESFGGSDIYNADDIILNRIMAVDKVSSIDFDSINGTNFSKVPYASSGEFGKYTVTNKGNGYAYKIFNPSSYNKAFYIEYTLKNIAVVHNDVAEIGWNIFTELSEYVNNLEVIINIPNNDSDLRAWGHGPIIGNVELIDNDKIKLTINGLNAYDPVDTRFVFSKGVVNNSTKFSNYDAMDNILSYEKKQADIANKERKQAKFKYNLISYGLNGIKTIMLFVLIIIIYKTYKKHDKEYKSEFIGKYFRDFPANYGPETVGYLFNRRIGNNDMSASLLNLIYKKKISFEEINKKDYLLKYNGDISNLNEAEIRLIKFIFGNNESASEIKLSDIKAKAKKYDDFISGYETWRHVALGIAEKESFYENKTSVKTKGILYSILGVFVCVFSFGYPVLNLEGLCQFISILGIFAFISSLIYFISFTKKTIKGQNDYTKWKGLKNYLNDFSRFDEKDLPEINLWEKYLVYAVSLGCADKLSKTMEIKLKTMQDVNGNIGDMMLDYHYFRSITYLNRTVNTTVNKSVSSAYSARQVANSNSSSSGGFGGGFSAGGGSFGGGGGGGRF